MYHMYHMVEKARQQEVAAAAQCGPQAGNQERHTLVVVHLISLFYSVLAGSRWDGSVSLHSKWVFPAQFNFSENAIVAVPGGMSPG